MALLSLHVQSVPGLPASLTALIARARFGQGEWKKGRGGVCLSVTQFSTSHTHTHTNTHTHTLSLSLLRFTLLSFTPSFTPSLRSFASILHSFTHFTPSHSPSPPPYTHFAVETIRVLQSSACERKHTNGTRHSWHHTKQLGTSLQPCPHFPHPFLLRPSPTLPCCFPPAQTPNVQTNKHDARTHPQPPSPFHNPQLLARDVFAVFIT